MEPEKPSNNPLRSEAAMFRVVVIVALAAAPVILAGLLIGPAAGASVLGVELGIGIGLLWRAVRSGETAEPPREG